MTILSHSSALERETTTRVRDFSHPLLEVRPIRRRGVVLIAADKGLCGALNSNLLREAAKFDRDSTLYVTAGRKASQFVARTKRQLAAEFTYKDAPLFSEAGLRLKESAKLGFTRALLPAALAAEKGAMRLSGFRTLAQLVDHLLGR